ncbi:MAG: hypothetical protein ACI8PZ_006360, partial [Myxococcota bacterium]
MVLAVAHSACWPGWWVEDAAIAFAYARNWAEGWGLVAFPGGERVEGYSDPLWVALLALGEWVGVDGFTSAKPLAGVCVAAAVWATWAAGERIGRGVGLAAALGLAASSPFAIWAASGLENPLFGALLAVGIWRRLAEVEDGGPPWSAVAFLGLALTRPEGVAYAVLAWGWGVVVRRDLRSASAWVALFSVPFLLIHGVRFAYFAQEMPATYHAKLGELAMDPLDWGRRGWRQLRRYLVEVGVLGLLPWLPVALTGAQKRRAGVALATVAVVCGLVAPLPDAVLVGGVVLVVVVPVLAAARPGPVLVWLLLWTGVAFAVGADGDWMRGFRWMSLVQVPVVLLLATAAAEASVLIRWAPWAIVGVAWVVPNLLYSGTYVPETSPHSVLKRVVHYHEAKLRLGLDRPYLAIDHDMGAMLWWGREQGRVIDARGLTDLPFALHHGSASFPAEYLYGERRADFVHGHAHAGAAMRRGGRFAVDYIEFPGYRTSGRGLHGANFVSKALVVTDTWPGEPVAFGSLQVHPPRVRAPEVGPGSSLLVEVAWSGRPPAGTRAVWFLAGPGGVVRPFDLPPGFDDWYPPTRWRDGEVVFGAFPVSIPEDLPLGTYDLGVVVLAPDGAVVPPAVPAPVPAFATGEHRWPAMVQIVSREAMYTHANADLEHAREAAKALRCGEAEAAWADARAHRIRSRDWLRARRPPVARALARCWARSALTGDPVVAASLLERAR